MKLGPFEIRRAQAAAAVDTRRARDEIGASGTVNLDGFLVSHEYNRDLQGRQGLDQYERMRSSDGAVVETLGHITNPVRNATWEIEPATTQQHDLIVAEATRRAFMDWPAQPFSEYLDHALDYLVFGHQLFEHPWQIVENTELEIERPDADPIRVPAQQYLAFRRFAPRLPQTIHRWNVTDGALESVQQQVFRDGGYDAPTIPADQLVVYVCGKRGDDFAGRSLLRGAYKHWVMKELVEKIEIVALERHGVGVWVAYPPQDQAHDTATLDRVEVILKNIRAGTQAYIVAPGPKALASAQGQNGWTFEIVSPTGSSPDFKAAKEYHRGEIKGSMLVRFAELGHASVGARATGDVQSEVWRDALHAVARHVGDVNQQPIRRFVDANFAGVKAYPRLVARDIESRDIAEFADAHYKLVNAGAIEPDRGYRRFVRDTLGAPAEEDPEAIDRARDASAAPVDDPDIEEE